MTATLHPLPDAPEFNDFSYLELNDRGAYIRDDGSQVPVADLTSYLHERIVLPKGVTDVFVWVHGWRNDRERAIRTGRRLFNAITVQQKRDTARYPAAAPFVPAFVLVRWPSESNPLPWGYRKIRDRARNLTEKGAAEFFLAALLGYLDHDRAVRTTLQSAAGFYIHCVGHSFGGRFLTAAIGAAANPESPATLSLLNQIGQQQRATLGAASSAFQFNVDSLLVFQMAAGSSSFADHLRKLVDEAPIHGPVVLTHSRHDRANCLWHRAGENGERAIGCEGAREPADRAHGIAFKPLEQDYSRDDLYAHDITNVDANWAFTSGGIAEGAHSDFWWEESIHLLLSVVNHARRAS
ncbi:MAG TPA: hypothetical protein VEU30_04135 [Thermoanaerobaculia bacterium]|nr:hypothetical protein [Thermoanaerobaculia bacterium]